MNIFKLPDLGEGLMEVELLEWQVAPGDTIKEDEPLLSVETAKAIVDIPSPVSGKVVRCYGAAGDILHVGDPVVEFETEDSKLLVDPQSDGEKAQVCEPKESDAGSVVGRVETGSRVLKEETRTGAFAGAKAATGVATGVKVSPAVRALARQLEVDLSVVTPSGNGGVISSDDVQRVAKILSEVGALQPLRGVRRAMAQSMTKAAAEVVPVTVCDDADIDAWGESQDVTVRLIRALVVGCRAQPSLNAWYDSHSIGRRLIEKVDLGIALDTGDGLFVPVLRDVGNAEASDLRARINVMKEAVQSRRIPPEELRGNTITLSNFGRFGGRYADPIVLPPTVAILGAGRLRDEVVAVDRKPVVHRIIPLSLTFDHRAVTGGEATRFLAAVMDDLSKAS
ncbi:MAG: dihydrolipoamide acetyltransferase family protein [Pseudomonadales bacterium]